jgi:hypothetical protein
MRMTPGRHRKVILSKVYGVAGAITSMLFLRSSESTYGAAGGARPSRRAETRRLYFSAG